MIKKFIYFLSLLFSTLSFAQLFPSNYYDKAIGLSGYALKDSLHSIIHLVNANYNNSSGLYNMQSIGYGSGSCKTANNPGVWGAYCAKNLVINGITVNNPFIDNYYEKDGTILDVYEEISTKPDVHLYIPGYPGEFTANNGDISGPKGGMSNPPNADGKYYGYQQGSGANGCSGGEGNCYNREHVIPKSLWRLTKPEGSTTPGNTNTAPQIAIGHDLFYVWPTDMSANSTHSNFPIGKVIPNPYGIPSDPTYQDPYSKSANGTRLGAIDLKCYSGITPVNGGNMRYTGSVWEPTDEFKGDFARSYLYFATRWGKDSTITWDSSVQIYDMLRADLNQDQFWSDQFLNILLAWNQMDPVSQREKDMNDFVYNYVGRDGNSQKNRNPFIDHPEWVTAIWGQPQTGIGELCPNLSTADNSIYQNQNDILIYPTLIKDYLVNIKLTNSSKKINQIMIFNLSGQLVKTIETNLSQIDNIAMPYEKGVYIIKVVGVGLEVNRKVIVE